MSVEFFHGAETRLWVRFGNMQVHHRGSDFGMSRLVFYAHNVKSHFQQMGGITVPKGMDTYIFPDPGFSDYRPKGMADTFTAHLIATPFAVEQPRLGPYRIKIRAYAA
jgi:hypothetical protein